MGMEQGNVMSDLGPQRVVVQLRWWAVAFRLALPLGFLGLAAVFGVEGAGGGSWVWPIVAAWAALSIVATAVVIAGAPRIMLSPSHLSWRAYGRSWSIPWEACGEFRATGVGIGAETVVFDTAAVVRLGQGPAGAARSAKADMALGDGAAEGWRIGARYLTLAELTQLLNIHRQNALDSGAE
jgi:hypothetical protein